MQRITQVIHPVGRGKKKQVLLHIIQRAQLEPGAGVHAHQVRRQQRGRVPDQDGVTAMALHGNKSQSARTQALAGFKTGEICAPW